MKYRVFSFFLAVVMIFTLCAAAVPSARAAGDMKTSESGIALIKELEGFSAKPFYDYGQYSVGYGTACNYGEYANGITEEQADKLLRAKLATFEPVLNRFAANQNITFSQQQFDALMSFTYNMGTNWMNNVSTFRTAVIQGSTGNDFIFAITMWCNAGGAILDGLVQRRLAEANLYLNGVYSKTPPSNYRYVIFNNNCEGAVSTVKIQGYDANATDYLRAAPSRSGYRLLGWYTQAEGGEWITRLDASSVSTLYAHWQYTDSSDMSGCEASYVRYASDGQPVYANPYGGQLRLLQSGTKLDIIADYMDNNGVKWGKIGEDQWVNLSETRSSQADALGYAVDLKVTVTSSNVNIRKGPGTSYPKAGTASKGQELQLTRIQQGGSYLWGQFSGGWVCLDYTNYSLVALENSANASKVTATGVIINTDSLNIREHPGSGYAKVGTYKRGDQVSITLQYKVGSTTWGKTDKGWISLYYVKLTPVTENTVPEATTPTEPETPTEPAEPDTPDTTTVVATGKIIDCSTLRIRAGAGTKYAQVGSLARNTKVSIYELVAVGSQLWGRIDQGWICMTYVQVDRGEAENISTAGTVVNCSSLNVRAGAGTMYSKVGSLAKGTRVNILETAQVGKVTWGRVEQGWISLYYVQLDGTLPDSFDDTSNTPETEATTPTEPDHTDTDDTQQDTTDSTQSACRTGVITGTAQLRIRSGPSASNEQVGTYAQGDRVVILETAQNGNATWGKTEKGWIHMFYVKLDTDSVPEGSIVRTVTTTLRIRAGAGTSYEAVGSYLRGTQVVITAQVNVNGTMWGRTDKGWISMYYVK